MVARFNEMRQQLAETASKIADLEADAHEHELVVKTLKPMDKDRKCYRLVGDVLVQRTVAETLPAVERNKAGLDDVVGKLKGQLDRQEKALEAFAAKYKIRVNAPGAGVGGGNSGSGAGGGSGASGSKPGGSSQGVLVS